MKTEDKVVETPVVETPIEEPKAKTAEELKAEAVSLEAENKILKEAKKEKEVADNYEIRLKKAQELNTELKADPVETPKPKEAEIAVDDIVTLRMKGFAKESDEAKVLKQFKDGGLITDYETGLEHAGVKAEIEAITVKRTAANVVDENDKAEFDLNTKKDVITKFQTTGEVPEDKTLVEDLAKANLEEMGL